MTQIHISEPGLRHIQVFFFFNNLPNIILRVYSVIIKTNIVKFIILFHALYL